MSGLHSISQSTISLFGVEVIVHQLNTGERVIEEASLVALFEAMGQPENPEVTDEQFAALLDMLT